MNKSGQAAPKGRRSGPVVDRVRALRARELPGRRHRTPASASTPMPEPGREWAFILEDLRRRARGEDLRPGDRTAADAGGSGGDRSSDQ
ncbi:MAG: hypothetical protein LKI24_13045 [Acidipropionibacterium sp.]|jgi:hypothetical protein|nr:hypothetical protein [Acidipropionibacterium sp.]